MSRERVIHDAAELGGLQARLGGEIVNLGADLLHHAALVMDEIGPALLLQAADAAKPVGVELGALIFLDEVLALDAIGFGKPEQTALEAD